MSSIQCIYQITLVLQIWFTTGCIKKVDSLERFLIRSD